MGYARLDLIYIVSKIAEAAIRSAAGLSYSLDDMPQSVKEAAAAIVATVSEQIAVEDDRILRCRICGKGPFTRKGLYLHVRRVHLDTIYDMVRRELETYLWRTKNI
ncbi:hypothetical protein [Hyperthermus butylicus]|uniref:Conserved crenarchaeal protein n=1 Tax=Hyperthermus butylicus (strain DSM 5456 / JCM 9403 / PLM1-5) TaxID=415426 RepID=A2BM55_HYPBU|nr:hypothetical protein [Hyperthermus butylicus]ABM81066.1 conserved crenarchaeal protein [Hyperthermus butylicus DSM 5456]